MHKKQHYTKKNCSAVEIIEPNIVNFLRGTQKPQILTKQYNLLTSLIPLI